MKLSYLQSIDPCDPLPKLGKKVEPLKKPPVNDYAGECFKFAKCSQLHRIDDLDAAISTAVKAAAAHVGTDTFVKAMSSTTPESVVSFADAAEMADGWIKWDGGECPVDGDLAVEVKFRVGETNQNHKAVDWGWGHSESGFDIIAYRVIKPAAEVVECGADEFVTGRQPAEPGLYHQKSGATVGYQFWDGWFWYGFATNIYGALSRFIEGCKASERFQNDPWRPLPDHERKYAIAALEALR